MYSVMDAVLFIYLKSQECCYRLKVRIMNAAHHIKVYVPNPTTHTNVFIRV